MNSVNENQVAVITGAAGGLGSCFAKKLAEQGYNLLLVDRRLKQLETVCKAITDSYDIQAEPYVADLGNQEEIAALGRRLEQMPVAFLVNNAGFGTTDDFVDLDREQHSAMIHVHVLTPAMLTRSVLPGMIRRDRGAIVNVSSLAAWSHSAGNVQYSATKTYLAVFSQALREELRGTGVRVQALCPGFVRTEFHAAEAMQGFDPHQIPERYWMSADYVVDCSLRRLDGKNVIVFPGLAYRVLGRLMQMPVLQPLARWLASRKRLPPTKVRTTCPEAVSSAPQVAESR